jgi:4-amino-4-deoxy-L-arabinose transferase-like glycosyltransferase
MQELTRQVAGSALDKYPISPYVAAIVIFFGILGVQQFMGIRTQKLADFVDLFALSLSTVFITICLLFAITADPRAIPFYPLFYPLEFLLAVVGLVHISTFFNGATRASPLVISLVVIFIGLLRIAAIYVAYISSEN